MIKVKDGYAKLIGTTYQGSATQVLLSNGGNLEFSSATKANTLVQRNASQHIYATYFNSEISDEALTDIGSVYVRNTSDTFIRRISKTQFYSIIDNKFVTLDTAQTITGVKTFAASFSQIRVPHSFRTRKILVTIQLLLGGIKEELPKELIILLLDSIILVETEKALFAFFLTQLKHLLGVVLQVYS